MIAESRWSWAVALGSFLGLAQAGLGQGLVAPAPGADLERASRRMADAIRDLGEDLADGPGRTPQGQYLAKDAGELQDAASSWYAGLRGNTDPYQVRRSYSGIDVAWHRLRGQLDQPGMMTQAVGDEVRRVEQADAQIHQALGLNAYPPNSEGPPPPPVPAGAGINPPPVPPSAVAPAPGGLDETRRLAYALAQRGEALAAVVQSDVGNEPGAGPVIQNCLQLARNVDNYYDSLNNAQVVQQPDLARLSFAPIVRQANDIGAAIGTTTSYPPRVRASWEAYVAVHNQLRNLLGLTDLNTPDGLPPADGGVAPAQPAYNIPIAANPVAPVADWANQLDGQVDDLLNNFAPTARVVPEGDEMLEDMRRLRRAVVDFRRDAAQGFDARRLALEFREVDNHWQRLARRVERIAVTRGRANGPNIERVRRIGQTCEQIHQVLGMPGYPPIFGP